MACCKKCELDAMVVSGSLGAAPSFGFSPLWPLEIIDTPPLMLDPNAYVHTTRPLGGITVAEIVIPTYGERRILASGPYAGGSAISLATALRRPCYTIAGQDGPTAPLFWNAEAVQAALTRTDGAYQTMMADVTAAAREQRLTNEWAAAWSRQYTRWRTFYDQNRYNLHQGSTGVGANNFLRELQGWREQLRGFGHEPTGPEVTPLESPGPSSETIGQLGTIATAAAVIIGLLAIVFLSR